MNTEQHRALRILVSVRNVTEAMLAADEGADFIDLKDPAAGALGGLPPALIADIVRTLRARPGFSGRISATVGDWPADAVDGVLARLRDVAAAGVDDVKVGIEPGPHAPRLIDALAREPARIVPVLVADRGVDREALDAIVTARASDRSRRAFGAVMLDTQDKRAGSLLQRLPRDTLRRFVVEVQAVGAWAGLAGALRIDDVPVLVAIGPDFAGFRSAVCAGDRRQAMDPRRLRTLRAAVIESAAANMNDIRDP